MEGYSATVLPNVIIDNVVEVAMDIKKLQMFPVQRMESRRHPTVVLLQVTQLHAYVDVLVFVDTVVDSSVQKSSSSFS